MIPRASMRSAGFDACASFALALLTYWLLGVDDFYKADGPRLVLHLQQGNPLWPQHPFYLPILIALRDVLGDAWDPFDIALLASSAGAALGVAAARVGFAALGLARARANVATLALGCCPAVLIFASVVEIHGLFFGFACLAFASFSLLDRDLAGRDLTVSAIALAALTAALAALAAGVHASGILLPAIFAPWLITRAHRWHLFHPRNVAALALGASFAGALFAWTDPVGNRDFVEGGFGRPQGVEYLPGIVWREYVLALAPLSLLSIASLHKRELRTQVVAYACAATPYAYGALKLLVGELEFGAYLLPLALPASYLSARAFGPRVLMAAAVLGAGLGIYQLDRFRAAPAELERRADIQNAIGDASVLTLLADVDEFEAMLIASPRSDLVPLDEFARQAPAQIVAALPYFDQRVAEAQAKGQEVWITEQSLRFLAAPPTATLPSGSVLLTHLRARYRLEACGAGGFRASRLVFAK